MFKEITSGNAWTAIVEKDKNVNILTNKFLKRLNGITHTPFKKTRIK